MRFKHFSLALLCLIVVCIGIIGCGKTTTVDTKKIYISGKSADAPCYWYINGDIQKNILANKGSANSIFIDKDTVYTTGTIFDNSIEKPCYWINKTYVGLDGKGIPTSIVKDSNKTFITGYYPIDINNSKGCYWNDGNFVEDDKIINITHIYSAIISKGTIYCVGQYTDNQGSRAFLKYGNATITLDIGGSSAKSIFINNENNIYISGANNPSGIYGACYWIYDKNANKKPIKISNALFSYSNDIFVDNEECVYNVGYYYNAIKECYIPCCWIGEEMLELSDKEGKANSIYIYNNIIYIAGWYNNGAKKVPCYWIVNNRKVQVVPLGTDEGEATDIFIKGN